MAEPASALDQMAQEQDDRMRAAKHKLVTLIRSYPRDTPFDHILFGYGGVKVTLADMVDAFNVQR